MPEAALKRYVFRIKRQGEKNLVIDVKNSSQYGAKQQLKRMGHDDFKLIRIEDN